MNIYLSKIIITSLFFGMISFNASSSIYKWVDEKGVIHYGDRPIEGIGQSEFNFKVKSSDWKGFKIKIDDVDRVLTKKELVLIDGSVNNVYRFFSKKLYVDIFKTVPVNIKLFGNKDGYQSYLLKNGIKNAKHTRGIFIPKKNQIVLPLNEKERWRTFWTVKHETSHAIVHNVLPYMPAWFNEGLAENMEALDLKNDRLVLVKHNENARISKKGFNSNKTIDLRSLLLFSPHQYYKYSRAGRIPVQAYSGQLVRMLLSKSDGRSLISRLINELKSGSRSRSVALIDKHYAGGMEVLSIKWNEWMNKNKQEIIQL